VLIIPSSWGSQLDGDLHQHRAASSNNFLAPLPGIEEEEAPTSTTFSHINYAPALNPMKCVFGVPAGQVLGFIVSHRGIKVNSEKIKAILDIS
jgi:hypothetical protein